MSAQIQFFPELKKSFMGDLYCTSAHENKSLSARLGSTHELWPIEHQIKMEVIKIIIEFGLILMEFHDVLTLSGNKKGTQLS